MKDRYAKLDLSKLPKDIANEFVTIKTETKDFTSSASGGLEANFNTLYEAVQSGWPEAIEKKPKLTKVKPDKVKVIKPKQVKKPAANASPEAWHEYYKSLNPEAYSKPNEPFTPRKGSKLHPHVIEFIEATLTNDEASTDEELIEHFVTKGGISEAQAKKWVKLRDRYLNQKVGEFESYNYTTRTQIKKEARKAAKGIAKDIVKTRDGKEVNRKDDAKNVGKTFYDDNGKAWKCKGYNPKLDECLLEDEDGKQISSCIKDMYVSNPVKKREKGDMIDECKDTLKEAGFTVKQHIHGTKKIKRSEPRPEKEIIKERVADSFTPILKDISGSEEKDKENKEIIELIESIKGLFTKVMNRISNLADDGKADALKKIEKLFKELVD